MTIIRDGKQIKLTAQEVLAVKQEEHRKDVLYDVEREVEEQEAEGWISFDSWRDWGDAFTSADDAREHFIEMIADDIIEAEQTYDRDPNGYKANLSDIVADSAKDMEYDRTEED